jgi:multidrug efflux pump subunit AcrA (membrane-fusion protein)
MINPKPPKAMPQPINEPIAEEVQEIMGTPPRWILRWGTAIIGLAMAIFVGISSMISYPDFVRAPIRLTTKSPPINVVARADGYIKQLVVEDGKTVKEGDLLVVLQSSARYDDVLTLEKQLGGLQNMDISQLAAFNTNQQLQLGELQAPYSTFTQTMSRYSFNQTSGFDQQNIGQLRQQIGTIKGGIKAERDREQSLRDRLALQKKAFERAQQNYAQNNISQEDLEKARLTVIDAERDIKELKAGMQSREQNINELQQQIIGVQQGSSSTEYTEYVQLTESLNQLLAAIEQWKQQYLIMAPQSGKISFFNGLWGDRQNVTMGQEVMAIVPDAKSDSLIGRVELPINFGGRVVAGQQVLIKFDSYPYQQFGIVDGEVMAKSLVPSNNAVYAVSVKLTKGLQTRYKLDIPFDQQMTGVAEIITAKRSFLSRILDPLLSVFKNR